MLEARRPAGRSAAFRRRVEVASAATGRPRERQSDQPPVSRRARRGRVPGDPADHARRSSPSTASRPTSTSASSHMLGRDADVHRAGHRQRAVERALLVQALAPAPQDASRPTAPWVLQGPGENAGVHRHRRRARRRVQDRVAQPPVGGRAVSGRGDRRRRHPARRVHDGRAPDRDAQLAALRLARLAARPLPVRRRREGHRRLRQLRRHPDRRRRGRRSTRRYEGNPLVNAMCVGLLQRGRSDPRRRRGRRQLRSSPSARARAATASTARRSPPRICPRRARRKRPRCRSAIRSPRSCCSRRASS